jgi:glycosyltransferase involved in cell wall biosynthesis
MTVPKISLVIPALNEETGVVATIKRAPPEIHEIIVVDGGSKDGTADAARAAGAKVIVEPRRGYGLAYKRGFAAAEGELIATADADGTYPVQMIPHVVEFLLAKNLDFISCSRFPLADGKSMRGMNKLGNIGLSLAASAMYLHSFRDVCSGMWVFRRSILPRLELRTEGWAFSNEFKLEAFYTGPDKFAEFVIPYDDRVGPTHNVTIWKTGVQVLGFMFYERVLHFVRSRITDPRAHADDPVSVQPFLEDRKR